VLTDREREVDCRNAEGVRCAFLKKVMSRLS